MSKIFQEINILSKGGVRNLYLLRWQKIYRSLLKRRLRKNNIFQKHFLSIYHFLTKEGEG